MAEEMWPYLAKFLNAAFEWAEKAPEGDEAFIGTHIGRMEVCIDGEVIGHIHTGDDLHYVAVDGGAA